jgi:hypothetical protein
MILHHALDVQLFNGNHAEAIDQPSCGLVNKIMAPVPDTLMDTGQNFILSGMSIPRSLLRYLICLEAALADVRYTVKV